MASVVPGQVSAAQVGSFFVGQYYHVLQQQPSVVHQFYTESSTMIHINGEVAQSATSMMQIHSQIMNLNFIGIEIKTIHSLDSWAGGVLVMVSGFVQTKDYIGRRKFMQTFFLAPQEKGYFVRNDIFHLLDEEQMHEHPSSILAHNNYEANFIASNPIPETVSDYMLREEIQANDYEVPDHTEENDTVDKYSIPDPQQQVSEPDDAVDETATEEPLSLFPTAVSMVRDPPPAPVEEPIGEPQKQTYASILRLAKAQTGNYAPQAASISKAPPVASDWSLPPESVPQQSYPPVSVGPEKSNSEVMPEVSVYQDEGEEKSVYVGNLPSSVSASDLEHEFKNFGRIKHDGVAIRSRKDSGGYYAFVEFEDVSGVKNALKASPVQVNGCLIYVEERRPNSSTSRGGRRGRGRGGGYQSEAPRGRFGGGRSYGRVGRQESSDGEYYSRTRVNGVQRAPRHERGTFGNHAARNGQYPSESAS